MKVVICLISLFSMLLLCCGAPARAIARISVWLKKESSLSEVQKVQVDRSRCVGGYREITMYYGITMVNALFMYAARHQ